MQDKLYGCGLRIFPFLFFGLLALGILVTVAWCTRSPADCPREKPNCYD
ncbi:MAG TPA: hypothetical protein VHZ78_12930 [Rhizomicrobium sp.]|jgi:hypothetical protein|nr:hypothetical protein [Rhizomicrobium sp.]